MISERAGNGLDRMLVRAVRSRLLQDSGDACCIETKTVDSASPAPREDIVVLTISSIVFRMLILFHVEATPANRAYFRRGEEERPFAEVFSEVVNLCCGALNQDLLNYFPDLGMSTPYRLDSRCQTFLNTLAPAYQSRHDIAINDEVRLSVTLCVCSDAPVDFVYDASTEEEASGELELF